MNAADPVNPQRVFWELSPRLPDDVPSCLRLRHQRRLVRARPEAPARHDGVAVGRLATMGCAMPYALAAKLAIRSGPVIAMLGDGAMQMIGINALITIADRWKQWADPAAGDPGAEQRRPEHGDLGAARAGSGLAARLGAGRAGFIDAVVIAFGVAGFVVRIGAHGDLLDLIPWFDSLI
jgi:hypothetical protein